MKRPERRAAETETVPDRRFVVLLLTGLVLFRLFLIPYPGAGRHKKPPSGLWIMLAAVCALRLVGMESSLGLSCRVRDAHTLACSSPVAVPLEVMMKQAA